MTDRQGWRTTDEQELKKRQARARTEPMAVKKLTPGHDLFADFSVSRTDQELPQTYIVELRSLGERHNFCTCPDFAKNLLGTCKHIEKLLMQVRERLGDRPAPASPFVEVFLGRGGNYRPMVTAPPDLDDDANRFLGRYLNGVGELKLPWQSTLQVFLRDLHQVEPKIANQIRVSREVYELADELQRRQELATARQQFEQDVLDGKRSLQVLRKDLYDYQAKGMMHLAFSGRAMLADEMGLGKTVQALAAALLMRQLWGIKRVLVICPASLKTEWEEQIHRFCELPVSLVDGPRRDRQRQYQSSRSVFFIMHYEQVLRDEGDLNESLRPDLIILDEAQRIKNWQTQTARSIKRLHSQFAFVLTGTPLENRIDEIYSIVEFINPRIFGSLFRFNREFYELDAEGKVTGYRNLAELKERLRPIMLRRRKGDIAGQLPPRVDNNYFVELSPAQRQVYGELEYRLACLLREAQGQPLDGDKFDQLQKLLAQLRMVCDSPYVLDQETRDAPKIDELVHILDDIWESRASRKVIVFSAWERMLQLVRERLERAGIEAAWHTGSVPVNSRGSEIERFRDTESCRVLLTTDAGAQGLNLQVASVVVNLDLPWNPARLEQRVARAWRMHQKRSVSVINLIAEETIEHRILHTLQAKQNLVDLVLDGEGDPAALQTPDGRSAFVAQLGGLIDLRRAAPPSRPVEPDEAPARAKAPARPVAPVEQLRQELVLALGPNLLLLQARLGEHGGVASGLVIVRAEAEPARRQVAELLAKTHRPEWAPQLHVLDADQYALVQRLAADGLVELLDQGMQVLYRAEDAAAAPARELAQRRRLAEPLLAWADRQSRMAEVLQAGEFVLEAVDPMRDAIDHVARALAVLTVDEPLVQAPAAFSESWLPGIRRHPAITPELATCLATYGSFATDQAAVAADFLETGRHLLRTARELMQAGS